jgi:hypothetical protein
LGVVTLVLRSPPRVLATFQAQHWTLRRWAVDFPGRVVDLGVCGRWLALEHKMHEYDNPEADEV